MWKWRSVMILRHLRLGRYALAALLVGAEVWAEGPVIMPISSRVCFSRTDAEHPWKEYITTPGGKALYVLELVPDYAIGHYLVGAMLVLTKVDQRGEEYNLLSPENGFGMQPYVFNALDLRAGIDKSMFGRIRKMTVREAGLVVTVTLKGVRVSVAPHRTPPGISRFPEIAKIWPTYPQLDELRFDVRVEPLVGGPESLPAHRATP
jgi:hypothetical protein